MDSKKFELDVIRLLKIKGFTVLPEFQFGSKKVDFLAKIQDEFGKTRQYIGECKFYKKTLTRDDISNIVASYFPLLKSNFNLLVVSQNGLTASTATYIEECENIYHISYADLLNSLMDFNLYIQGLKSSYSLEHLDLTYVPQGYNEGNGNIEDYIEEWLKNDIKNPLAILGGYGMGKTTLATRLAYTQSIKYENDSLNRIPIYIKLEDLSTESSLEGLLGKLFTSVNIIKNYSFPLFMKLNEDGMFLIILDGFDEMKRTMSEDALIFNFEQLNRLIAGKSKLILLGRPTVFLDEKEQNEIFHGVHFIYDKEHEKINYPDYIELNLKPFDKTKIEDYISKMIECYKLNHSNEPKIAKFDSYLKGLNKTESTHLIELASRPVQLKMLTDILPIHDGDITKITVTILYSEFIDLITRRETKKIARKSYSYAERRDFASSLAFWMWKNNLGAEIDSNKIDPNLIKKFNKDKRSFSEVKRDLITGCFLEKKQPSGLYFPHRTFQEFFVAEELHKIVKSDGDLSHCPFLTPEIKSFFIEMIGEKDLKIWRKSVNKNPELVNSNSRDLLNTVCAFHKIQTAYDPIQREIEKSTLTKTKYRGNFGIEKEIISKRNNGQVKQVVNKGSKFYINRKNK